MIPDVPHKMFRDALKQYRRDVPNVGTVTYDQAQAFLDQGRICRGWMDDGDGKMYFHIIKSPTDYPEKSLFSGESEQDLFRMTIIMGMQSEIELYDLFTE